MVMNPSSEIIKRKSILSPLNDWLDQGYWQLRSTKVGALAGLLWLASLACPALINYGGDIYGCLVLLIGWITLSGFLVAWAANIFFLWALWRLLKGYGSALLLSWIAVICSVDTIRFADIRGYDNINSSDLYGFGLGALIWFAALLLMGIAASFRALEMAHQDKAVARPLKYARWSSVCAMFALLALLIVGAVHQGMYQRRMAAPAEREFLARAIFKLGTVCTTPDIEPQTTIRLSGPVELITDDKNVTALYYGSLLQWGVPVVRYKGVDYSLRDHDESSSVVISPPIGEV